MRDGRRREWTWPDGWGSRALPPRRARATPPSHVWGAGCRPPGRGGPGRAPVQGPSGMGSEAAGRDHRLDLRRPCSRCRSTGTATRSWTAGSFAIRRRPGRTRPWCGGRPGLGRPARAASARGCSRARPRPSTKPTWSSPTWPTWPREARAGRARGGRLRAPTLPRAVRLGARGHPRRAGLARHPGLASAEAFGSEPRALRPSPVVPLLLPADAPVASPRRPWMRR